MLSKAIRTPRTLAQPFQIAGPKSSTEPQALLNTAARAGPLAQQIVKNIINNNADPDNLLLYNPLEWLDANQTAFPANDDWLNPPVHKVINGKDDFFSQECVFFPAHLLWVRSALIVCTG